MYSEEAASRTTLLAVQSRALGRSLLQKWFLPVPKQQFAEEALGAPAECSCLTSPPTFVLQVTLRRHLHSPSVGFGFNHKGFCPDKAVLFLC